MQGVNDLRNCGGAFSLSVCLIAVYEDSWCVYVDVVARGQGTCAREEENEFPLPVASSLFVFSAGFFIGADESDEMRDALVWWYS